MPLKLIVGPPNSGRVGEVLSRLEAELAHDPVLVVPTGDDAAWFERELCAEGAPVLGVSIRTFAWLFEDVATALGAELRPLLTAPQRLALVRAAIATTRLGRLARSAHRPGFAPALDALISELQAAMVSPREFTERAAELDDGAHEAELASLYAAYVSLRDRSGRSDTGALAETAIAALRERPDALAGPPVFLYGFDDLTVVQRELLAELSRVTAVTVAVNYADRRSLTARAALVGDLREQLGAETDATLDSDPAYTERASLRHLDRSLFDPKAAPVPVDDGVVLMDCAGERGEAEAIGTEVAKLLAAGADPADVAIVARHPAASGPVLAGVLSDYGIPVALEAQAPVEGTAVGRALIALCRAATPGARAEHMLAHLRADPAVPAGAVDGVEERIRRGEARTSEEAVAHWQRAPRHLTRLRAAGDGPARLQLLAGIAREVAEGAHRGEAPLAASGLSGSAETLHPLELRAAVAAAELLEELATLGDLPDCPEPDLAEAIEALEGASIRTWRGPTDGRVRILSPYRLRAGRARFLFCTGLQDGEFPAAAPPDPLLGDDRRAELGIPALRRREQADEERYLFHACVSRPTERLYLAWRSSDGEGQALSRSPFVDEVLDLLGESPGQAEEELVRMTGLERVVAAPGEAPSERELARSLAAHGFGTDPGPALESLALAGPAADRVQSALAAAPRPNERPGPLRVPRVLEELRERDVLSANQLEGWLSCPYRWFVGHELEPVRLEPESDPLWLGSVVHSALDALYREAPGDDSIPREGDLGQWQRRFGELLQAEVGEARLGPERVAALARVREQVDRFLADEAESETALRPRPDLLERSFGMEDEPDPGGLELGDFTLRGRIDRIDVAPDGSGAVVRDYKTGTSVTDAAKFAEKGALQVQLYMRATERLLGLDVIGGLYQPLGATGAKGRRPRGLVRKDDERLAGLELVRGSDHCEEEDFERHLDDAEALARKTGDELRRGEIGRRPLNGSCPRYCTFQPICRLERAVGLPDEDRE